MEGSRALTGINVARPTTGQRRMMTHATSMAAPLDTAPKCPGCGRPMRLVRVDPRIGGLPELQTFECRPCGVVLTQAGDKKKRR
jgi:hypothetical protein